ncbi:hypothetical protein ACFLXT_02030 [Chloroflexota bacterium]
MNTNRELDLLVDIAKLLKKYGPEPFELLEKLIRSTDMTQNLSQILNDSAKVASSFPRIKRNIRQERPSVPKSLTALQKIDPDKYLLLLELYERLISKTTLRSLKDVKDFALDHGLMEVRAKTRHDAISPLIGQLTLLPNERLKTIMEAIQKPESADRSLKGWSNIILDKQRWLD